MKIDALSRPGLSIFSVRIFLIDFLIVSIIYFIPTFSHMLNLPLYILDPMRIAVFLCLIHTSRKNTFLIAVTLPLFSLLVSSHPAVIKTILITAELLINLLLFYYLIQKANTFISLFLSIVISKVIYYTAKFAFIQMNLIDGSLISTPFLIQWIIAIALSFYVALKYKDSIDIKPETF